MILNIFANFWNEQSFICQIEFSRRLVQSMAIRRSFVFALTEIREFSSPMYEIRSDSKNNIFANVCVLGLTLERPSSFVLVEICQIALCAHSPIVDNFSTELTLLWAKVVFFCYLELEKRFIDEHDSTWLWFSSAISSTTSYYEDKTAPYPDCCVSVESKCKQFIFTRSS